ncbi:MAG: shikimate kinase [Bacteroidota bacterium]
MAKHLFLIGFMGAGKSHWGLKIANRKNLPFVDLDRRIEDQTGKSVPQLFQELGSEGFRLEERQVLQGLANLPSAIVATGGGTPCFFDNLAWMKQHGRTVYLKVPLSVLLERLEPERRNRPLLANLSDAEFPVFVEQLLADRTPIYLQSEVVLEYNAEAEFAFIEMLSNINP